MMTVGNAAEEFNVARLWEGPSRIVDRVRQVTRELNVPRPTNAAEPTRPDAQTLVAYIVACTGPSDRILAFTFMPELYYFTNRGFAAGFATFVIGAHDSEAAQRLALTRWRSESVPYAVAYEGETVLHQSFPLIAAELKHRYVAVFRQSVADDRGALVVYAERGRAARGTYEPLQAPCVA
ncbi:MAG TPA: hypothetical protein VGJ78_03140 [Vicinamibacterales bacterium]